MTKNLVIVESPTKAKVITQYLGKEFKVLSSNWHIRDLPAKKSELSAKDQKLPYANIWIDAENGFEALYVISDWKKKIIDKLKKEITKDTIFYLATDEDREWEAISWHLLEVLDKKREHESKRVVFHEITKSAIEEAFKHPRKLNDDLVEAQQARRFLDRIVWYKLSPLLWKKIRFWLSAWRVQSACVRIVVDREREIQAFVPEEYWTINALLSKGMSSKQNSKLEEIIESALTKRDWQKFVPKNEEESSEVLRDVKWKEFKVDNIEKKETIRNPSPPFITSSLQQDASRKLWFTAKKTMMVAQKLYEWIEIQKWTMTGLITYMRTDSVNLSEKALKESKEVLTKLYGKEYALPAPRIFNIKSKWAQEAHEAIRPTDLSLLPDNLKWVLENDEQRLYELIWKRTLASQAPQAVFDSVKVRIANWKYEFQANGQTIKFPWFIRIYVEWSDNPNEALEWKDIILPEMTIGEILNEKEVISKQHFTKWPARYTEASLIKKMEEEWIWRPSTYAPTISTIQSRWYIVVENKHLMPTDTAFVVTDLLKEHFTEIVDLHFTSWMEDELDNIAEGKTKWRPWLLKFYNELVAKIASKDKEINKSDITNLWESEEVCDKCWKKMMIKLSKFWKFLSCSWYPDCKNAKPLETKEEEAERKQMEAKYANEKCPECKWSMSVKSWRFGKFLACNGYPDCKWLKKIDIGTWVNCPKCSKWELVERKSWRWKLFWSCNTYPKCKFATWSKPIENAEEWKIWFYTEKKWEKVFIQYKEEDEESENEKSTKSSWKFKKKK